MENSKIEWCDDTVNLWWGCHKVHTGCKNCYAEYLSDRRYKNNLWGNNSSRKLIKSAFNTLQNLQELAKKNNTFRKVFIGSMMDIFEEPKSLIDHKGNSIKDKTTADLRFKLFSEITQGKYDNLVFLFLTKRPQNINKFIPNEWISDKIPNNIWFGTSISNQETAEKYMPLLTYGTPTDAKLFLSVEPQVGAIDITKIKAKLAASIDEEFYLSPAIDWVIQGGESGHNKRPFNLDWAHSLKGQCLTNNIPYFFKQIDKKQPIPDGLMIRQFPPFMM